MSVTLIANSGIQFYKFDLSLQPNEDIIRPVGFYEFLDEVNEKISLQYAYYLPDLDIWVPKSVLKEEDYLDENDQVKENVNFNILKNFALKEGSEYFTVSDVNDCMELFASGKKEQIWLPVPYFKTNSNKQSIFGPIAWARMMIKELPSANKKTRLFKVILAFDTKLDNEEIVYFAPRQGDTSEEENVFNLTNNEDHLLNFCDAEYSCEWVEKYLKKIVQKGKEPVEAPYLKYIASTSTW